MNLTKLKNYAPQARQAFVQAMTDRAAFYGVTATKIEPVVEKGDVAFIGGREHPRAMVPKRKALAELVAQDGFAPTMEKLAYTWFNRLVAIRYMELHGYLDHGYRVLSHPEGRPTPEILEHAEHVELPGLDKQTVINLKLDGSKDAQLYRLLLVAQCNALNETLPFLFARIDDEAELLLPDNLLHSESLLRKLVSEITQEDCGSVEILGWLYQFYISERKDEVMARKSAVPTQDIPAVTQLFTPHWIVRYLVENSLGRLWLLNRPGSKLREHMPYYVEGEAETNFLKVSKPEDIRLLDPAVGSGHMLTYAFDLLCLIYEEEGYVPSEIPALILRHNLYGLEICPRAAQLAELALVFKAREKSRRFFQQSTIVQPRILALQNVCFKEGELPQYIAALSIGDLFNPPMLELLHQFKDATTVGSLILPCLDEGQIVSARRTIKAKDLNDLSGQLFLHETHGKVLRVLEQAEMLTQRYHVVVANPPYMGGVLNPVLSSFVGSEYPDTKSDISSTFVSRALRLPVPAGYSALVAMHNWMFVPVLEKLRRKILSEWTIVSIVHHGIGAFPSLNSKVVQTAAFVLKSESSNRQPIFLDLRNVSPVQKEQEALEKKLIFHHLRQQDFLSLPDATMAYWVGPRIATILADGVPMVRSVKPRAGISTGENEAFIRYWYEPALRNIGFGCFSRKNEFAFFPHNKAGGFRKWYGYASYVLRYDKKAIDEMELRAGFRHDNADFYFKECVSWGKVTSGAFSARFYPAGFTFDGAGLSIFPKEPYIYLGLLNSIVFRSILAALSQTMNFFVGDIGRFPMLTLPADIGKAAEAAFRLAKADWDNLETSWEFRDLPMLRVGMKGATLLVSWDAWRNQCATTIHRMQELETENNRLFIEAYGLADELKPDVPEEQVTLARASTRRDMAAFLSYAVGCMMGRYALGQPGIILANAGESLAEYWAKVGQPQGPVTFAPDEDGIIPVLDGEWFEDDIVARAREFLRATFGEATLGENLRFLEESLGKDLRQYFTTDFYKDHLQTYRRRPIYWLFSSGKQRAFQCLVYLHRYNEATLSRMRIEYVIPLQSRVTARIELLEGDKAKATSTSHRKKLQKEQDDLKKQQTELLAFDEKLKHAADQKIKLDLDDGVKVNYAKFGDLLAEVKAVTGGTDE